MKQFKEIKKVKSDDDSKEITFVCLFVYMISLVVRSQLFIVYISVMFVFLCVVMFLTLSLKLINQLFVCLFVVYLL